MRNEIFIPDSPNMLLTLYGVKIDNIFGESGITTYLAYTLI